MNVRETGKRKCKFCKQVLINPNDIEIDYHLSCYESFQSNEFAIEQNDKKKFFTRSLDLSEHQVYEFIINENIKYKENENGKIIELELIKTELTFINISIVGLEDLQVLTITNDYYEDHHEGCFWNAGLKIFPENITKLKNLKKLNLSGNSIQILPEAIGDMVNLTELNLELNNLKILPDGITELSKLEILNLNFNPIETFPENINNLSNLKKIFLDYTLIYNPKLTLPTKFGYLNKLEELIINSPTLEPLPKCFKQLKNLYILSIHGDYVRHNRVSIYFDNLPENLRELDCSYSNINLIPEEIGKLTHLQKLILANNDISTIPEIIMKLKNLTYLNLQGNKITKKSQKEKSNQKVNDFFNNLKNDNGFVIELYPYAYKNNNNS